MMTSLTSRRRCSDFALNLVLSAGHTTTRLHPSAGLAIHSFFASYPRWNISHRLQCLYSRQGYLLLGAILGGAGHVCIIGSRGAV